MNTFVSMDVIESCVPCQRKIMEDGIKIRNRPKSYLLRVLNRKEPNGGTLVARKEQQVLSD